MSEDVRGRAPHATQNGKPEDSDARLGAVETDRQNQAGQGNPNLPALDDDGRPKDWKKICEDVIGANVDDSQG